MCRPSHLVYLKWQHAVDQLQRNCAAFSPRSALARQAGNRRQAAPTVQSLPRRSACGIVNTSRARRSTLAPGAAVAMPASRALPRRVTA